MLLAPFHQWKPVQDQVSSNGRERVWMSGPCDILDTTAGETYWVILKISSSIHFISVADGGRKQAAGKLFLLWDQRLFTGRLTVQGRRICFWLFFFFKKQKPTSPTRCLLPRCWAFLNFWGIQIWTSSKSNPTFNSYSQLSARRSLRAALWIITTLTDNKRVLSRLALNV